MQCGHCKIRFFKIYVKFYMSGDCAFCCLKFQFVSISTKNLFKTDLFNEQKN